MNQIQTIAYPAQPRRALLELLENIIASQFEEEVAGQPALGHPDRL